VGDLQDPQAEGRRPPGPRRLHPGGRRHLGKLTTLLALLREHGDAVEADLQRFYRVDLAEFYRGELSVRRLSVLVDHLPHEAATTAARLGTEPGWSLATVLTADVFHALTGKAHPARPAPRPGAASTGRYRALRARLEAQKARRATQASAADPTEAPPLT
jgi:hypothetical protein